MSKYVLTLGSNGVNASKAQNYSCSLNSYYEPSVPLTTTFLCQKYITAIMLKQN